jgi:outer membrane protein
MSRICLVLALLVLSARVAEANDLKQFYELALTRDTTLQAAQFQRDALVEVRPQAIAQWLPQVSASASALRERVEFKGSPALGTQAGDCAISSTANSQRCYGTAHSLGLNMSQSVKGSELSGRRRRIALPRRAAESIAARGASLFRDSVGR